MVARALLHYHYFSLSALPKSARRSALLVQIHAWSPFPETAYAIVLRAQGAMVFAWDASLFRQRLETAGRERPVARVIPETLLLPPQEDGVSLLRCIEGWEGQAWREGELVQSRWWPDRPDTDAWLNFQRGASLPVEKQQAMPPEKGGDTAWLSRPWARLIDIDALRGHGRLTEHLLVGTLALALLVPSARLLRSWQDTESAWAQADNRHDQLQQTVGPILAARKEAIATLGAIEAIAEHVDRPSALALLAHVSGLIPTDGSYVRELEWQGEELRLVLVTPATTSRSTIIRAFEAGHWLRNVRETPESTAGQIAISAKVVGVAAPASDSHGPAPTPSKSRKVGP